MELKVNLVLEGEHFPSVIPSHCYLSANGLSVHLKTSADSEERVHGHVSIIMGVTGVKDQKPSLPVVTVDTVTSVSAVR